MQTQRFEAASFEEAMEAARGTVGPAAKVVGANKVRRGGIGGFFARERVEVEVEVDQKPGRRTTGKKASSSASKGAGTATGASAGQPDDDPLSILIDEMAQNAPSSVLDLAESVNEEQSRFSLSSDRPAGPTARPVASRPAVAPPPAPSAEDFAEILARIAQEANLLPPDAAPLVEAPQPAPADHANEILGELGASLQPFATPPKTIAHEPPMSAPAQNARPSAGPQPSLRAALEALGVPASWTSLLPSVPGTREEVEEVLAQILQMSLPPLPATPKSTSSVIAIVGPRGQALTAAKSLSAEIGAPLSEIAIASQRKLWRQSDRVIASPEQAAEERRSWRWRGHPSVVAIEAPVRPSGSAWALAMLQALQPALSWGVVEASHKPEDVAAWSAALGGLDAIALVDMEATTTPALALARSLQVARIDGHPATAQAWAKLLCARLSH